MSPIEPIPESVDAADELDTVADDDLLAHLRHAAGRTREIVPDLLAVSVARTSDDLTFTLVATDTEIAVLDAVQYFAGGPCVEAVRTSEVVEVDDILSEERWQLFTQASAARAVRSTLTLPIMDGDQVVGSVNLYGASQRAFVGLHDELAGFFGAWAPGAVSNADLSFASRREAEAAPGRVRDRRAIGVASGIIAAELGIGVDEAEERLRDAAARAGVTAALLARAIISIRHGDHGL